MNQKIIYILENYLGLSLCAFLHIIASVQKLFSSSRTEPPHVEKVLFLKFIEQGALILHGKTFAEALKRYGRENIYICTFSSNKELLTLFNIFHPEHIIVLNEKSIIAFAVSYFKALIYCRKQHIAAVIDLEFLSRATAIFSFLSGAKYRAGYHNFSDLRAYRGNLLTHKLVYSPSLHVSKTGLELLRSLLYPANNIIRDTAEDNDSDTRISFKPETSEVISIHKKLKSYGYDFDQIIIVNPNFNDPLPHRQWPPFKYARLIHNLSRLYPEAIFILTGRTDESDLTDQFIAENNLARTINLCGATTLRSLLTLYSVSDILICSDSGPGHFASMTDIKSIVMFGPETPALYGPVSENGTVIYKALSCSPCYNVYNNRTTQCNNNICMKEIDVDIVTKEVVKHVRTYN